MTCKLSIRRLNLIWFSIKFLCSPIQKIKGKVYFGVGYFNKGFVRLFFNKGLIGRKFIDFNNEIVDLGRKQILLIKLKKIGLLKPVCIDISVDHAYFSVRMK